MPHPKWDNLDDFLRLEDFAVEAQFTPDAGKGTPFTCAVIFDIPQYDAQLGEYSQAASEPRCTARREDVKALKKHDLALIQGIHLYLTHDPLADGTGMAVVSMALDLDVVEGGNG